MDLIPWLIALVVSFLCGSIPFAVLISRAKGIDIRTFGSGNPGASNLGRALGKRWGILCFVLDVGKGLVPTILYGSLIVATAELAILDHDGSGRVLSRSDPIAIDHTAGIGGSLMWVSVAVAAVLGHVFSPWLGFRGGKGVATGLGATLGLFPVVTVPALIAFVLWYLVAKMSGYVGLASVFAAASLPPLTVVSGLILRLSLGEIAVFAGLCTALAALVVVRHAGNLRRITRGEEPKAEWTGRR